MNCRWKWNFEKAATRAQVVTGAHVTIVATQNGDELAATRVTVGESGQTPR